MEIVFFFKRAFSYQPRLLWSNMSCCESVVHLKPKWRRKFTVECLNQEKIIKRLFLILALFTRWKDSADWSIKQNQVQQWDNFMINWAVKSNFLKLQSCKVYWDKSYMYYLVHLHANDSPTTRQWQVSLNTFSAVLIVADCNQKINISNQAPPKIAQLVLKIIYLKPKVEKSTKSTQKAY